MRPLKRLLLVLVVVGMTSASLPAQRPATNSASRAKPLEVLFIGNSYTYVNNLGDMVAGIAASVAGPAIHPTLHVSGGMTLQWHFAAGKAQAEIAKGGWDDVILQEQSVLGGSSVNGPGRLSPPTLFHESVRKFVPLIRAANARPILLMTWAQRDFPENQEPLTNAYQSIGKELNVTVSPAGLAWQRARKELPQLTLHLPDGSHPNEAGTYLTACVLYVTLTGRDPRGAAATITGHPWSRRENAVDMTQTVALATLPPATAARLQQIAWVSAH